MIDTYIERLSGIYEHFLGIEPFDDELKKEVFIQDNVKQLLSGFDYVTFEIIDLLKIGTERLGKTLADLSEGKINKKDVEFYETQAQKLIEYRRLLRTEFDSMNMLLIQESIDLYQDTKLDEAFGKIKNFMNIAGEIPTILGEINKNFTRSEDRQYLYFEAQNTVSLNPEEVTEKNKAVQINEHMTFDINNQRFIDIKSGEIYRVDNKKRKFMEILIENSSQGQYVDYTKFAEEMGLVNHKTYGDASELPKGTADGIRYEYGNLRKSLRRIFDYKNGEDDFCGGANKGYRLPFLNKNLP